MICLRIEENRQMNEKKHTNEKVGLNVIVVVVSVALPALTVVALLRFSASFYSLLSALLNCKQHWLSHQCSQHGRWLALVNTSRH